MAVLPVPGASIRTGLAIVARTDGARWLAVREDRLTGQHVSPDGVRERLEQRRRLADPVSHRGTVEIEPVALEDLALPVERQMIGVFVDQDVGEQAGPGSATLDRAGRQRRLRERLAARAREARPHDPVHDDETLFAIGSRTMVECQARTPVLPLHLRPDAAAYHRTWRSRRRRWSARLPSAGYDRGSDGASACPSAPREGAAARSSWRSRSRWLPAPAGAARSSPKTCRTDGSGGPPVGAAASPLSCIATRYPAGQWISIACDFTSASKSAVNRRSSPASSGRDWAVSSMSKYNKTRARRESRMHLLCWIIRP